MQSPLVTVATAGQAPWMAAVGGGPASSQKRHPPGDTAKPAVASSCGEVPWCDGLSLPQCPLQVLRNDLAAVLLPQTPADAPGMQQLMDQVLGPLKPPGETWMELLVSAGPSPGFSGNLGVTQWVDSPSLCHSAFQKDI